MLTELEIPPTTAADSYLTCRSCSRTFGAFRCHYYSTWSAGVALLCVQCAAHQADTEQIPGDKGSDHPNRARIEQETLAVASSRGVDPDHRADEQLGLWALNQVIADSVFESDEPWTYVVWAEVQSRLIEQEQRIT